VVGYPGTRYAYIVPVAMILGEIEERLDCRAHMFRAQYWMDKLDGQSTRWPEYWICEQ
jgi:hypothetical protein